MRRQATIHWRQRVNCFLPTIGILGGVMIAFALHAVYPRELKLADQVLLKVFELCCGLAGWVIGVVLEGKRPHCGGTVDIPEDERRDYALLASGQFFLLILALLLLIGGFVGFFMLVTLFVLGMAASSIAYDDCWFFLKASWSGIQRTRR